MISPDRRAQIERLLDALAETSADEASCSETLAELNAFVEAELSDNDPAAQYPAIAAHLKVCPDCAEHYATLVDILDAGEEEVMRPSLPFSLDLLSPPQGLVLKPGDVITASRPADSRSERATVWLRAHPQQLEALRVASRANARSKSQDHDSGEEATYEVRVPELGDEGHVSLVLLQEGDRMVLSGLIKPWQGLKGRTLRLYTLIPDASPRLDLAHETQVKAAGRLEIGNLDVRTYVLTIAREEDDDIPLALIPEALWREDDDE